MITDLVVTNLGNQAINGPLVVVLDRFSDLETFALHPDGLLPDGRPYFDLTSYVDGVLEPGQSTQPREVRFTNPGDERFDYRLITLAALNRAPGPFTTTPVDRIEAGRTYRYAAAATDADGQTLRYSIIRGPETVAIDPTSGALSWETTSDDIGRHALTVRATDPYGLYVDQAFQVQVVATLQNRPPNFTSSPVTDAIASSGFEISTVPIGDASAAVTTIGGFQGPRLVSVNPGDQTVSVHTGQNDDRFDDVTTYSTGQPVPASGPLQSGYSVDIGLPDFMRSSEYNTVLGLDQGDFNGDGILDLAALTFHDERPAPTGSDRFYEIAMVMGDGDGNFGVPVTIPLPDDGSGHNYYKHLQTVDVDGDGNLDLMASIKTKASS